MADAVKWRELIKLLEANGWYNIKSAEGSHLKYVHDKKKNFIIIVVGHLNRDVPTGLLHDILKQAGIKRR